MRRFSEKSAGVVLAKRESSLPARGESVEVKEGVEGGGGRRGALSILKIRRIYHRRNTA
jgi:hypothetical protein